MVTAWVLAVVVASSAEKVTEPEGFKTLARMWLLEMVLEPVERECARGGAAKGKFRVELNALGQLRVIAAANDEAWKQCVARLVLESASYSTTAPSYELVIRFPSEPVPDGALVHDLEPRVPVRVGQSCQRSLECGAGQFCDGAPSGGKDAPSGWCVDYQRWLAARQRLQRAKCSFLAVHSDASFIVLND